MRNYGSSVSVLAMVMTCAACGRPEDGADAHPGDELGVTTSAILNGVADGADVGVVALFIDASPYPNCTGTLIAPTVVLTAAHCVAPVTNGAPGPIAAGRLHVRFGQFPSAPAGAVGVHAVDWDPRWGGATQPSATDLAVAILSTPVGISFPPLWRQSLSLGELVRVAGFGMTSTSASATSGPKYTGNTFLQGTAYDASNLPMLVTSGDANPYFGDSGGPAFVRRNGVDVLVGVTSGGNKSVGLYASVAMTSTLENGLWIDKYASKVTVESPNGGLPASDKVVATVRGLPAPPPNTSHWIALTVEGAPLSGVIAWSYVPTTTTSGAVMLPLPSGTPPRKDYRVRIFAAGSSTLIAESTSFAILGLPVTTDAPGYVSGGALNVAFADSSPEASDWLSIAPVGSPVAGFVGWQYAGGVATGTKSFATASFPPGKYVARYTGATKGLLGESVPFVLEPIAIKHEDSGDALGNDKQSISFFLSSPTSNDWVGLFPVNAPLSSTVAWQWTQGQASATLTFDVSALPPASYVARYVSSTGVVRGETALSSSPSPATVSSAWAWAVPSAQADSGGATINVQALPAGRYVGRFYRYGQAAPIGESYPFTLTKMGLFLGAGKYYAGDAVKVLFESAPDLTTDWVALALVGSAPSTIAASTRPASPIDATIPVGDLAAGYYVARYYRQNGNVPTGETEPFRIIR